LLNTSDLYVSFTPEGDIVVMTNMETHGGLAVGI